MMSPWWAIWKLLDLPLQTRETPAGKELTPPITTEDTHPPLKVKTIRRVVSTSGLFPDGFFVG